jgi:uncharacterized UBP type Zn finger protein
MTRRKLKILKFQNTKIENFQNSHEKRHIPHFLACENFTQKIWKTPKMTIKKLKILESQNTKTKNFQSSHEKKHIPHFLTCEPSHKKIGNPQNDKKKIKDSKFQNTKHTRTHTHTM